jgi:O-antigen biosynthesis protein
MNHPDITLIITNWNGRDLLRECLPSVISAVTFDSKRSYEIMVVDDCSSDDSLEILAREFPIVRAEKTPVNFGFHGANNYGAELSQARLIMPMNNDIKLDEDRTTFLYGNRGGYFQNGHFYLYEKVPDDSSQTLFACGGAFMVDRQRYLKLGGFDPVYHPLYYEEIDLSYRALKRGWKVLYEPKSVAYHKVQSTITKQEKGNRIGLISARNNYLFVWKNILDRPLTCQFLFYIPLFLIRDLFRMKSRFWIAFYMALKRLPRILKARRQEKSEVLFSDREILQKININLATRRGNN